jgi:xylulokinase
LTEYLLGVDLGTSSAKALLVDTEGNLVGQASVGYRMFRPRPAWAEHDPTDFYEAVVAAVRAVVQAAEVSVASVAGLAIVAQREPPVLLNERMEPCARAISWTDQRGASDIQRFAERFGPERYMDLVGLLPNAGSTLASLLWMQRCTPDVLTEAQHLLFPKDYVLFRLTGEMLTDISTPGRSGLLDIRRFDWSEEVCAAAGVELSLLPRIAARSGDVWGALGPHAASELGLPTGTPLAVGGGDDPAAALGGGAIHEGDLCAGTGTASSWRIVSDQRRPDRAGLTELAPHVIRDVVIREASITGTGSSMRWCRDHLMPDISIAATEAGEDPYVRLIRLAQDAEPGAGGVFFYPYLEGSLVPRFDPDATGIFFGITGGIERRHLIRAVIEGITFQYALAVEMLRSTGEAIDFITVVDGEAESRMWSQLKADVIGIEVRVPRITRAAGLGAAILAGLATGVFATVEDAVAAMISDHETFSADISQHQRYGEIRQRYEEVYACISEAGQYARSPTHTN